ncbi:MAG: nickel-dependent hydrogenase large subunit, partial [bacterium]|nr:nickel-dependent hydrogenase large subunit [bacterium]
MSIEGGLDIDLYCDGPVIDRAVITSSRPLHVSRLLVGKTGNEVVQITALVFSICAMAQSCAAALACERAMEYTGYKDRLVARNMIVELETAREHMLRIALDWPEYVESRLGLDDRMEVKSLMKLPRVMEKQLFASKQAFEIGARPALDRSAVRELLVELETLLQKQVFGEPVEVWRGRQSLEDLEDWSDNTNTLASRFVNNILQTDWSALGAVDPAFLPAISDREMFTHITGITRKDDASLAVWKGRSCETGPLSRRRDHPLVEAILAKYGAGLLARTVARLCELVMIPGRLSGNLDSFPSTQMIEEDGLEREGFGLAQVEAARGRLVHL